MKLNEKLSGAKVNNTAFVFDFDGTMIHKYVKGGEVPSIISILRSDGYLGEVYSKEAYALKNKYHPIEIDSSKTREEKLEAAEHWWSEHEEVLIRHRLSIVAINKAVQNEKLILRQGFEKILRFSREKAIPLFIFSASGIGKDSITKYLSYKGFDTSQVYIISNSFIFDSDGFATGRNKPLIHGMNKNEEVLKYFPIERDILYSKEFIILAGDSTEDPKMVDEKNHGSVYRIGFCNSKDEVKLKNIIPKYEEIYDMVCNADSEMLTEAEEVIILLSDIQN